MKDLMKPMNGVRHIIWTNYTFYEDEREFYEEEYPDCTDEQRREIFYEHLNMYLDAERLNLGHIAFEQPILAIADLGFWNGRSVGYKRIESGEVADCLWSDCDYATWYVDALGEFRYEGIHHDGRNHVMYRAYKPGVTWEQQQNLEEKLYLGKATRKDITRLTERIGDKIAAVYGWKVREWRKAG